MAGVTANSTFLPAFERQFAPAGWRVERPHQQTAGTEPPAPPEAQETLAACAQHPGLLFFHAGTFNTALLQAAAQRVRLRLDALDAPAPTKDRLFAVFIALAGHLNLPCPGLMPTQSRIALGHLGEHFWVLYSRYLAPEQVATVRPQLDALRTLSSSQRAATPGSPQLPACTDDVAATSALMDPGWLAVAHNSSAPVEYGFSSPRPDGGSQLHVRAWI